MTVVGSNGTVLPDGSTLAAGETVAVSGAGFTDGEQVHVVLRSTPTTIATVTATSAGTVAYSFTVPSGLENGSHTLTLQGESSSVVYPFFVDATPGAGTTPLRAGATPSGVSVIPVGAPNTGAGGTAGSNGDLIGLGGGLALLLAGAGATLVLRRRQQV
jgi:hypothetical protein